MGVRGEIRFREGACICLRPPFKHERAINSIALRAQWQNAKPGSPYSVSCSNHPMQAQTLHTCCGGSVPRLL